MDLDKIYQKLKENIYVLAIIFTVLILFFANYIPGTTLAGWDNLQTELSPFLALKRAIFASWEEYQSFGLTSGMAHAADITRSIFVIILSLIFKQSFVRYLFHFSMIMLGSLSIFNLLVYLGFNKEKKAFAFIGALFYILNLGMIQLLSVPFEPFSIFFGFLPLEVLVFLKVLDEPRLNAKTLIWFILVNLLATSQAYLQTLFFVYLIGLGSLFVAYLIVKPSLSLFKRGVLSFLLIVIVNLFWILPQVYFVATSLSVVKEAKINQLATDIVSRQNANKGYLSKFARMEGFYIDLSDSVGDKIFSPWLEHLSNPFVNLLSYLPFLILLVGLIRKSKFNLGFGLILFCISVVLLHNVIPFSFLNTLILQNSFIGQIFRSPFTKFGVLYALTFTYFFTSGLDIIYNKLVKSKIATGNLELSIYTFIFTVVLFLISLPALKGEYFASIMRVNIPDAYFEVMDYFNHQDKNKRIALLPDYTFWGWFRYKWGYDGSGFLWYGIEQPIVSRTFDVWSLKSESYFWEIKRAIESVDLVAFENVLEKYNIDYLVLDYNLLPISSIEEGLQYDQMEKLLRDSQKVYLDQRFQNILVYKVNHEHKVDDFVSVVANVPTAYPNIEITNKDSAFEQMGLYASTDSPEYIYPFLDLTTQTNLKNPAWHISEDSDYFIFTSTLSELNLEDYTFAPNEVSLESKVFLGDEVKDVQNEVQQYIEGNNVVFKMKKQLVLNFEPSFVSVKQCKTPGRVSVTKHGIDLEVSSSDGATACFGYEEKLLAHWNGYLVRLDSENLSGNPLFFYIVGNIARRQSKLETDLHSGVEYFVLNPGWYFDDGYYFSFQNRSYEYIDTTNVLKAFDIYLLPFDYIKNIRLVKKETLATMAFTNTVDNDLENNDVSLLPVNKAISVNNFEAKKVNYYKYRVSDLKDSNVVLVLNQAFDKGWFAYKINKNDWKSKVSYIFGERIKDHFEVNNWSNGWKIDDINENQEIVLVFLPQYLEYLGLAAILVTAVPVLIVMKRKQ